MQKRNLLLGFFWGVFGFSNFFLITGCNKNSEEKTAAAPIGGSSDPNSPPYLDATKRACQGGVKGIPGIINGQKLSNYSPLAKHTVAVHVQNKKENPQPDGSVWIEIQSFDCSASIITPDTLLLAAHCFDQATPESELTVYFGTDEKCEEAQKQNPVYVQSSNVAIHKKWVRDTKEMQNDIALIFLDEDIPSSHAPVALMKDFPGLSAGQTIYTAGFGKNTPGLNPPTEDSMLRLATLKTDTTRSNNADPFIKFANGALSPLLIVGDSKSSVCKGDSGGPNFIVTANGLRQVGITADALYSQPERACLESSVAVNTWYHREFIDESVEKYSRHINFEIFR